MPLPTDQPILKITPDRRTFVVYRAYIPQLVCPARGHQRDFSSGMVDDIARLSNTVLRESAGLELALNEKERGSSTVTGDSGYISGTTPAGYPSRNVNRSYPEVPGAATGSMLAAYSGPVFERTMASGDSLGDSKFRNVGDEADFPGPGIAEEGIAMDRVFTASEATDGQTNEYIWIVEPHVHNRVGVIPMIRAYFCGPATFVQKSWRGYGQYAVAGLSDGTCKIYERGFDLVAEAARWRLWTSFHAAQAAEAGSRSARWAMRIQTPGAINVEKPLIRIRWGSLNDKQPTAGGGFLAATPPQLNNVSIKLNDGHLFRPPRVGNESPPTHSTPIRADVPRPFKTNLAVRKASWATSGFARDRAFHFAYPHWVNPIRVEAYGSFPPATSTTIKLFRNDGTEIAPIETGEIGANGRFASFDPGMESTFYPEFHFTGTGSGTPTLRIVKVIRDGTFADRENDYRGELPIKPLSKAGGRVSILTGGADPLLDSFSWSHVDIDGSLGSILTSGFFPFTIETEFTGYDAGAPGARRCILGGGVCEKKPRRRRHKRGRAGTAGLGAEHPHPIAYEVEFTGGPITFVGSVQRTLAPDFGTQVEGAEAGQPRKASEALIHLLNLAGWPEPMISIPDSPVRLFPSDTRAYELDFNSDFMDVAVEIAKSYFGGALLFDWNSGEHGRWKLILPPGAPYSNKCIFTTALQESGKPFALNSYAPVDELPVCPILDLTIQDLRPQTNFVEIIGGTDINGQVVRQTWQNTNSYAVHPEQSVTPEAMEHPDWIGFQIPIWKRNSAIQSDAQASWICARLGQQLGHASKLINLEAPLLLIPHEDDSERRRPLRFGDACVVRDGEDSYQCIVRAIAIGYEKDSRQMAVYELETVRDA